MLKESLPQQIQEQVEVLKTTRPEDFSQAYDSCVDLDLPEQLLKDTITAVNNGEIVGVVIPHQSFGDVEVVRHFCKKINDLSAETIESYEAYSLPAVGVSIKDFFESRRKEYEKENLNMIGVIREIDKDHPKYSKSIDSEMKQKSQEEMRQLVEAFKGDKGFVLFIPFESTLQSGRTNPETGQIYGMQKVSPEDSLLGNLIKRRKKRKINILPCAIDGGYKILHPGTHSFSPEFIDLLRNKKDSDTKVVTAKASTLINISHPDYLTRSEEEIFTEIVTEIAQNLPPEAHGDYKGLIPQSSRINLL